MNLDNVQLEMTEELAGLFYTPKEISNILEVDPEEFENMINSESGNGYKAYMRGYYKSDIELRKSITESALQGSSPAQSMLRDIQKLLKIKS